MTYDILEITFLFWVEILWENCFKQLLLFRYLKIHLLCTCISEKWLNEMMLYTSINPFPHIDTFWRLRSRQLFENMVTKEEIAQNEQFLLLPQFFPLLVISNVILSIIDIFNFLTKYVQSLLLQNCRMRERVWLSHSS